VTAPKSPTVGSCIWAEAPDGKTRPGVVLRITDEGRLLALFGTGTSRPDQNEVSVLENSAAGRALGLSKPTFSEVKRSCSQRVA